MLNLGGRNVGGSAPCDGVNNNNKKLLLFRCDAMRCDAMLGGAPPLISYSVNILRICIPCVRQRLFGLFPICVRILNIYVLPLV